MPKSPLMMSAIRKPTRVEDAYERLKAEILENRLASGYQATEPEITARMGMSRTPVREALLRLEAEGLIELIPRHGIRVLPISAGDMREIYELLTVLEPEVAARLAQANLGKDALQELGQATEEMEVALAKEDLDAWAEADNRFHRKLLEMHGNKRLSTFVRTICDQAHRARMMTLRLRQKPTRSTTEHRQIMTCILEGDADGARETFRRHREQSAEELLDILENLRLHAI